MPKRLTPTQRTLKYFRSRGVACAIVEKWVKTKQGGFRLDCFHFDILALVGMDTLGIQAGVTAHHPEKVRKAIAHPDVKLWLTSPYRSYIVLTWGKYVKRNKDGRKSKVPDWRPRATRLSVKNGKVEAGTFILSRTTT